MGERKVLNKYYPPDFDYKKIRRVKMAKNRLMNIRMMLPFSISCTVCGNFMYAGTKFNSKKEDVEGVLYKGIQVYRFYMKCPNCHAFMTFLTDPETADYKSESGMVRTFEPWKKENELLEKVKKEREEAESGDTMKQLENKKIDTKREMEDLDALDELRAMGQRSKNVKTDRLLSIVAQKHDPEGGSPAPAITDADEQLIEKAFQERPAVDSETVFVPARPKQQTAKPKFVVRKRLREPEKPAEAPAKKKMRAEKPAVGLVDYSSDSDE